MIGGFNILEYVVRPGDSLYSIARKHNISEADLKNFNNIKSQVIYPNQILFIPLNREDKALITEQYITKNGDTLEKIMKRYNIDFDKILEHNDLYKLELIPNQIINLKSDIMRNKRTHLIRPTDTIESIMNEYNISYQELLKLNEANWFIVGDSIKIR